jgi:hypothetical protein
MGQVVLGVDPALGGGFARVVCDLGDKLTILDAVTTYDLSRTEEQIDLITETVKKYRPSAVIIEFDAQQKGLGNDDRMRALSALWGFQIRPHITRGTKMDEVFGVASMDQSFKVGDIRIPYGDQLTQDRMSHLLNQLRAWRPDIKTKNLTQDLVMALWFVWRHWMQIRKAHQAPPIPARRPSWVTNERLYRGVQLTS